MDPFKRQQSPIACYQVTAQCVQPVSSLHMIGPDVSVLQLSRLLYTIQSDDQTTHPIETSPP